MVKRSLRKSSFTRLSSKLDPADARRPAIGLTCVSSASKCDSIKIGGKREERGGTIRDRFNRRKNPNNQWSEKMIEWALRNL